MSQALDYGWRDTLNKTVVTKGKGEFLYAKSLGGYCPTQLQQIGGGGSPPAPSPPLSPRADLNPQCTAATASVDDDNDEDEAVQWPLWSAEG